MSNTYKFWESCVNKNPDLRYILSSSCCVKEISPKIYFRGFAKHINDFSNFDVSYVSYNNEHKIQHVTILFDPEAKFNSIEIKGSTHDGTLYFTYDLIEEIIQEFVQCNLYLLDLGSPQSGSHITYTVGNFVIVNQHGDFGTKDKPWLNTKTLVFLPFKYEVESYE